MVESNSMLPRGSVVLKTFIHALSWDEVLNALGKWTENSESKVVCLCNVHSCVTAGSDPEFADVLSKSDLVLPDGMPIAWVLRKRGFRGQPRIGGPDLMWKSAGLLERSGKSVFLYGSTPATLKKLESNMKEAFPSLCIAGAISPPYRELTESEDESICEQINQSGATAVFVALGCPKQEFWMLKQRGKISAVMFGFGAAFDFHAGSTARAPLWMQRVGLEWFHRLMSEPRRLWRRYLVTNTIFVFSMLFGR